MRRHAERQHRPVPHGAQVFAGRRPQHVAQHVGVGRLLALRRLAVGAPDAGEHLKDGGSLLALLRRLQPGAAVHPADCGHTAADRGRR